MFVRARMPASARRREHLTALHACRRLLPIVAVTVGVLILALFVIDMTPHLSPAWPHSVGLTAAAVVALVVQTASVATCYRDVLATQRRRTLAGHSVDVDVAFDSALPIGRHRSAS
jgi:hypothetical protein